MIELTEEQRQAIAQQPESPVRVIDPETKKEFVLTSAEWFAAHVGNDRAPESEADEAARYGVAPCLFRGMKTYWRDLPTLLRGWWKRGKWVAYHGATCLGTARTALRLLRKRRKRSIPTDEIYVALIEDRSQPPWEPESFDGTLYEFDEDSADVPDESRK